MYKRQDETSLFFKCLPDKTIAFKGVKCFGRKGSKEKVTVMVAANMSGAEFSIYGLFLVPRDTLLYRSSTIYSLLNLPNKFYTSELAVSGRR